MQQIQGGSGSSGVTVMRVCMCSTYRNIAATAHCTSSVLAPLHAGHCCCDGARAARACAASILLLPASDRCQEQQSCDAAPHTTPTSSFFVRSALTTAGRGLPNAARAKTMPVTQPNRDSTGCERAASLLSPPTGYSEQQRCQPTVTEPCCC